MSLLASLSPSDPLAKGAIATAGRDARRDQVTQTGQTGKCLLVGAHRQAQPCDFRQTARQQRRFGVVSGADTVDDPGCNGDNVLQRTGQFDADHVRIRVDAEPRACKSPLDVLS